MHDLFSAKTEPCRQFSFSTQGQDSLGLYGIYMISFSETDTICDCRVHRLATVHFTDLAGWIHGPRRIITNMTPMQRTVY